MKTCTDGGKSEAECELQFTRDEYLSYKYQVSCQLEHPGLPSVEKETFAEVIEACVTDCQEAGRCPAEDDEDEWDAPQDNCPHPNTMGAFQACSYWGDPHWQAFFEPTRTMHYSNLLHSRGRGRPSGNFKQASYNNYKLGLQRLFRTTIDETNQVVEAQGFFCDARGHTSSTAGVALRIGARTVTMLRPAMTGPFAWSQKEGPLSFRRSSDWNGSYGLDLSLDGEKVPWEELGDDTTGESKNVHGDVENQLQKGKWWAQQMSLQHDNNDKSRSFKPMCVGDSHRQVMIKASVPHVFGIYEPVVTIEMANDLVKNLESEGLCMGPDGASKSPDVSYSESLFSVPELYQLCTVCNMLTEDAAGTTNRADGDGWESTPEALGCIHPPKTDKIVSGQEVCEGRGLLDDAKDYCGQLGLPEDMPEEMSGWHDSCLAEYCNAANEVLGVHAEAEESASNLVNILNDIDALAADEAAEFGS